MELSRSALKSDAGRCLATDRLLTCGAGDSFTLIFWNSRDAMGWCLEASTSTAAALDPHSPLLRSALELCKLLQVQRALLVAPWPAELDQHPCCALQCSGDAQSLLQGEVCCALAAHQHV